MSKSPETVEFKVKLTSSLRREIKACAAELGVSMNAVIVGAIAYALTQPCLCRKQKEK